VHRTIRHAVADVACPKQTQAAHRDCGSGRTVAVEIADDDDPLLRANRSADNGARTLEAAKIRRQHPG
jgi:hypothetical protein